MSIPEVRVPLQLDRPRILILDFNALCRVEEVTGVSLLVGQPAFSSMRMMRALVWAGLLHQDPTLTLEFVGNLIQEADAEEVLGAIMNAYDVAMPEPDTSEEGAPEGADPTSPQPGEVFGQSGGLTSV